ncbi:MAG: MBL fold metallo-hydrolase [Clostridiales bacterium]|jgi:glyoxylase-like metal-dependent hydrolase (beta-lactamase superfamily II)|nr:MBL fold metallo-hydrolase [Clostridiales bacterium]
MGLTTQWLNASVAHIQDLYGVAAFLVLGSNKGLLIDTCMGMDNIKKEAESLTALPFDLALTHGHLDHVGGIGYFSKAYIHPNDIPLATEHSSIEFRAERNPDIPTKDLAPSFTGEFLQLADGQIFDLGGLSVETIALHGHTKGSVCFLIRECRAILFGDACNINTLIMKEYSTTISEYLKNLKTFKSREKDYDTVYYSHGPAIGPTECLDDNIELCERILAGKDDALPCEAFGRNAFRAAAMDESYRRLDGKFGNIVYSKENAI